MSKQVLDIKQMLHLKELGIDISKASMCYRRRTHDCYGEEKVGRWSLVINQPIIVSNFETYEDIPAFTLQDILDLLPKLTEEEQQLQIIFFDDRNTKVEYDSIEHSVFFSCKELIDSAYEMLCWCVEKGHIKTAK